MPTATPPASFYDTKTIDGRWAWLREENRRRCEEAARRKAAGAATDDGEWTLTPPAR